MTQEEKREQAIQSIAKLLRDSERFDIEFEVVKEPKGIRVVCEVTQEQMDILVQQAIEKRKNLS